MTKSIFSLLLMLLIGSAGFAQTPDSVLIDHEWRYVYPVNEQIDFVRDYYIKLELEVEEFPIWIQWKEANDPRAKLKTGDLKQAIQRERYNRKEVTDSIWEKRKTYSYGGFKKIYSDKDYRENQRLLYGINCKDLDFVPPLVRDLPDGKYVQFFETYVTYAKRSKCEIIRQQVAAKFELQNNNLQNQFQRFAPDSTLLTSGSFEQGFKTGNWTETDRFEREMYRFTKRDKQICIDNTIESNYVQGLKDGKVYFYYGESLTGTENYRNGKQVGEVVMIEYADSIIYDLFTTFDPLVNYNSLAAIHSYNNNAKYLSDMKHMADYSYLNRLHPGLFESFTIGEISNKTYPDSVLKAHKTYFMSGRSYSLFETSFKVFDRKTKQLIFRCTLDTVTKLYSGSSWYKNGQKFDTIWTDPVTMKLERIIYDTNGVVVFNSLNGDRYTEIKMISGYPAQPAYDVKKNLKYYYYEAYNLKSDTTYRKFNWDINGKMTSMAYQLGGDSIRYSIVHYGDNYCLFESNYQRKQITYVENGIKLTATIPLKGGDPVVNIDVNGQPYEGRVEFRRAKKKEDEIQLKGNTLLLNYAYLASNVTLENGGVPFSPDQSRYSSVKLMQLILLNFEDNDLWLDDVSGTFKNNRFEGNVILEHSHKMELNYVNGLPTGRILIYRKHNKYSVDLSRHNEVDTSCHFSEKRFHKRYLYKSYSFNNGILDGPMVFYTSGGDTSGIIPFVNGVKNGKVFQYEENDRMTAEFKNDVLINDLVIYSIRSYKYDTLWYIGLNNQGNLMTALQKSIPYRGELMRNVEHRVRYKNLENGIVECTTSDDNRVLERELVKGSKVIQRDIIQEKELKYTELFTDTLARPNFYGLLQVLNGKDEISKGIVWNKESDKRHDFSEKKFYESDYEYSEEHYPRYIKKYFSNGEILREGAYVKNGRYADSKYGVWKVNDYNGTRLYEINYHDSVMKIGSEDRDVIGVQTEFDSLGNVISTRAVLSEDETYECSSDDYYAERQYITLSSKVPSRMNGLTKNYYDNGALMNEGKVINGIPEGLWKFYTPDGKLTRLGSYQNSLENGKWLFGDLGEKAYIGEVCIDPDDPEYEVTLHQLEMDKEIEVVVYKNGKELGSSSFSSVRRMRSSSRYGHIDEPDF